MLVIQKRNFSFLNEVALPQPRTDYVPKSFSYSGTALSNSLPTDIRVSRTLGEVTSVLSELTRRRP